MPAQPFPMPLSHTRMSSWEDCRFLFKATYLDKVETMKSIPMYIGGFFHEWADGYVKHLMKTKQSSDLDYGRTALASAWAKRQTDKEFKYLPEAAWDEVEGLVEKFLGSRVFNPSEIAGAEVSLAFNIDWKVVDWLAPDVFFRLKIDRLDIREVDGKRVCLVTDYKTGHAMDTPDNPQLRRYVMGVATIVRADRYVAALDFVRLGVLKEIDIDPVAAEKEKARILAVSNQIERAKKTSEFFATPGPQCAFCPVFDICPAKKFAKDFRSPQTADEAVKSLQDMILLERRVKDIKAALQPWVLLNGPIVTGSSQYGVLVKKMRDFNLAKMTQWAIHHQIDPASFTKVSTEDLDKVLGKMRTAARKGNADAEKALEDFPEVGIKEHSEYRLMAVKEKDGE